METPPSQDHDLLIELNANVKNLSTVVANYTATQTLTMQDHETRLRNEEKESSELRGAIKGLKIAMTVVSTLLGLVSVALAVITFAK